MISNNFPDATHENALRSNLYNWFRRRQQGSLSQMGQVNSVLMSLRNKEEAPSSLPKFNLTI